MRCTVRQLRSPVVFSALQRPCNQQRPDSALLWHHPNEAPKPGSPRAMGSKDDGAEDYEFGVLTQPILS